MAAHPDDAMRQTRSAAARATPEEQAPGLARSRNRAAYYFARVHVLEAAAHSFSTFRRN